MRPSPFSGHGAALGEASTEDSGRLSNTAREPWPGAAPVRRGSSLGVGGREAALAWALPGSALGVVGHGRPQERGAGGWGGSSRSRERATRIVSWPLKIFPGVQGVPVPEAAGYSHPGRGRADSAELGLVGQQRLIRKEPPSCPARRRGAPA